LPPQGEIKHGDLSEETFTNQATTCAKMYAIDRTTLINDDLGALTAIPRKLGRQGALKLNEVFRGEFMDYASFSTSAHFIYGATSGTNDSRMSAEGLQRGLAKFGNKTDNDGRPLALEPRFLPVPPAIEVDAGTLLTSTNFNTRLSLPLLFFATEAASKGHDRG
jgi:phage major head subunit gpT-like protein